MSSLRGLAIELEEMGTVAMIGLLLVPGMIWIARGRSGLKMMVRAGLVGTVIVGAIVLDQSMDKTANSAEALLDGKV